MTKTDKNFRIPLFYAITSLFWFSLYSYVPGLSLYAENLGANHRMVGLIISSYGFVQMLLRIPLGIYSDRLNRRKIFIILGILASIISSLGMASFKSPFALLIFRGISGIAAAAWVPFTVLFSSYFSREDSTKALGYINSFNALGQMAALLSGGIIIKIFISDRSPFYLASIVGLLALLMATGIVENKIDKEPLKFKELIKVGMEKDLLIASGLAVLSQLITFATVFGFTPLAAQAIGADQNQISLLTTLSSLPGIFAAALSGSRAIKNFGRRRTIALSFLVMALTSASIPLTKNINTLYLSQMIGGFARSIGFSLLMSLSIIKMPQEKRATAMGFFQSIYGLGMFIGPIMVGFISDFAGLDWGFWITGIIGILGTILSFRLIEPLMDEL